jgi:2-keto-3-deoxy-L-rhamnonate aldolase RhmA
MKRAGLKEMSRSRKAKLGHFIIEFATPGIGHILKTAGCDFVFFDLEHSGFGFESLKSSVRFFEAAGVPMIVRLPSKDYAMLARACDVGAEGLMVPMVNTADEARAVVSHIKYYPEGKRGVALGIAHDNFATGSVPVGERMRAANERTTLFCLIETEEGVENADAIAAVAGVDCIWIGHFDLTTSLGIPGEFEHPKYLAAVDKIKAAGRKHNRSLGRLVSTTDEGIALYKQGFDFCCYSGDVWVLQQALTEAINILRGGCV